MGQCLSKPFNELDLGEGLLKDAYSLEPSKLLHSHRALPSSANSSGSYGTLRQRFYAVKVLKHLFSKNLDEIKLNIVTPINKAGSLDVSLDIKLSVPKCISHKITH